MNKKEEAIKYFEETYKCKWEECCNCIVIKNIDYENTNFDIRVDLDLTKEDDEFIMFSETHRGCYSSLIMIEDFLNIVHLYYLGDKDE